MNQEFIRIEGDIKRSHAMYRLPLKCMINGVTYGVYEWSVVGVVLEQEGPPLELGKEYRLALVFPFDGFDFTLDLTAVSTEADGKQELRYVNLTRSQVSMFRFILDAYLSGEVISAGDILDLSKRGLTDDAVKAGRRQQISVWQQAAAWIGRAVRSLLLLAVAVVLASFVAGNVVERLNIVPAETGLVAIDFTPVFASEGGVITNIATGAVANGQPVATVMTASHNSVTFFSPCDCSIETALVSIGSSVSAGAQVASLRPNDLKPYILAYVGRDHMLDLYRGVTADVEFADGSILKNLSLGGLPSVNTRQTKKTDLVPVKIPLPDSAASSAPNQPVTVLFVRTHPFSLSQATGDVVGMVRGVASTVAYWFSGRA